MKHKQKAEWRKKTKKTNVNKNKNQWQISKNRIELDCIFELCTEFIDAAFSNCCDTFPIMCLWSAFTFANNGAKKNLAYNMTTVHESQ